MRQVCLTAWLTLVVLGTSDVAARQMVPPNPSPTGCDSDSCIVSSYAVASAAVGAVELFTIAFNSGLVGAGSARTWMAPLGVASGGVGIALGAVYLDREDEALALGVINMGVGAVALGLGLKEWLRPNRTAMGAGPRPEARFQPTYAQTWDGRRRLGMLVRF